MAASAVDRLIFHFELDRGGQILKFSYDSSSRGRHNLSEQDISARQSFHCSLHCHHTLSSFMIILAMYSALSKTGAGRLAYRDEFSQLPAGAGRHLENRNQFELDCHETTVEEDAYYEHLGHNNSGAVGWGGEEEEEEDGDYQDGDSAHAGEYNAYGDASVDDDDDDDGLKAASRATNALIARFVTATETKAAAVVKKQKQSKPAAGRKRPRNDDEAVGGRQRIATLNGAGSGLVGKRRNTRPRRNKAASHDEGADEEDVDAAAAADSGVDGVGEGEVADVLHQGGRRSQAAPGGRAGRRQYQHTSGGEEDGEDEDEADAEDVAAARPRRNGLGDDFEGETGEIDESKVRSWFADEDGDDDETGAGAVDAGGDDARIAAPANRRGGRAPRGGRGAVTTNTSSSNRRPKGNKSTPAKSGSGGSSGNGRAVAPPPQQQQAARSRASFLASHPALTGFGSRGQVRACVHAFLMTIHR